MTVGDIALIALGVGVGDIWCAFSVDGDLLLCGGDDSSIGSSSAVLLSH